MKRLKKLLKCVVFFFFFFIFLIPKESKKTNATTVEECQMLFDDSQLNQQITDASRILLNKQEFRDYLKRNTFPHDGSFTDLNELKNDVYFSGDEQSLMINAFSLFKGFNRIEIHDDCYIEIVLLLENRDYVSLYYFPKASVSAEEYESWMQYFQQFCSIVHIDDNWCMGI